MGEAVIFTPGVAEELVARGFKLLYRTECAWHFEDSVRLWRTVGELLGDLAQS